MSCVVAVVTSPALHGQARTARDGVYTGAQATRGQAIFKDKCAPCHGEMLEGLLGPPLAGDEFLKAWGNQPLAELVNKIQKTMPQSEPGTLTRPQAIDLVAHILQVGKFPAGQAALPEGEDALKQVTLAPAAAPAAALSPVASHAVAVPPPSANLAQLMRGIFFPSSNIIFNVQGHDPGEKKDGKPYEPSATDNFSWADWGAGIYSPWEVVDFAGLAIADAAPLLLAPGRRCENGRAVPVDNDDWNKFTRELIQAGKAAYKASQSRNQETVSDVSNQLADACLHCHEVYRDKPGGTPADPSNKAARCVP
ncbi:MAG TPA: cytochrome c [Vicinamibacterales bacterium]|nr:cytochrome c [Vicinamibacterales bacterium]